jgi:hypothetical protein
MKGKIMKRGTTVAVVITIIATIALVPAVSGGVWATEETEDSGLRRESVADQRERLRGLEGVGVLVEGLPAGAERYRLDRAVIQAETARQLCQRGIRVLSEEERIEAPGSPNLYVDVYLFFESTEDSPLLGATVQLSLVEIVSLERDHTVRFPTPTWQARSSTTGSLREPGPGDFPTLHKGAVSMFVKDYLAANPKEREDKEPLIERSKP